jgi:hypothetical protein
MWQPRVLREGESVGPEEGNGVTIEDQRVERSGGQYVMYPIMCDVAKGLF